MGRVFISYRRLDSQDATGRINYDLDMYFGREATYRDIDRLHPGCDFRIELTNSLKSCALMLVVIGGNWLTAGCEGKRRLDDPDDLVRIEVASAIAQGLAIIPVLTGDHVMPRAGDLPADMERLASFPGQPHYPRSRIRTRNARSRGPISELTGLPFEDYPSAVADCQQTGLVLIRDNFRADNTVLNEMVQARELLVVMNDGRGWLDQNREIIYRRLQDPDKMTRVVLLHPASPFIDTLIGKNGKSKATQREEIGQSSRSLIRCRRQRARGGAGPLRLQWLLTHIGRPLCLRLTLLSQ